MTNSCVLVDIDGTLADCTHRRHHVEKDPKDWNAFSHPKAVAKDSLIFPVAETVRALHRNHVVIYVSGRKESLRHITISWLRSHCLWEYPQLLYLRSNSDNRSDTIVKEQLLHRIREDGWEPFLAIDDRSSVVSMWRENGIVCLQAADGMF